MSLESSRTQLTLKDPLFFIRHASNDKMLKIVADNYTFIPASGDWELGYVKPEVYEQFLATSTNDFVVLYSPFFEKRSGFIDDEYRTITRDKASRFYAKPTAAHFFGLILGWTMIGMDGEGYPGCEGESDNWTPVEDECWYGDIDSVILNLVMPKTGNACGCGSNYSAVQALDKFLRTQMNHPHIPEEEGAVRKGHLEDTVYRDDMLGKAFWFIAYVLDAAGFTEHGSGIRHGWLQFNGSLLAMLIAESVKRFEKATEEAPAEEEEEIDLEIPTKEQALAAAIELDKGIQMLNSGEWTADPKFCETAMDQAGLVRHYIELN